MELTLRGSEYSDFLQCRKKWFHGWVENITPKRADNKLFFGNLMHKWLENYYQEGCNKLTADLATSVWFNEQDLSDMPQEDIDDLKKLFKGVSEYYHEVYGENDSQFKVIATEMKFLVKLEDGLLMEGTIDLVYETMGKIRFMDHKTASQISTYEDKATMDRQISRYWWALKMISAGIARVWNETTQMWERFEPLIGKDIDGFDYNIIAKDYPREPKVLKPKKGQLVGELSKDKSQKTTHRKYLEKIHELGHNPEDYAEMLQMLKDKPDPFLKRINVIRNDVELESAAWEFLYTAGDIHDIKLNLARAYQEGNVQAIEAMTYRNIGSHCTNMCQFKSLCQTTIEGGNISLVKNLGYKLNEERVTQ